MKYDFETILDRNGYGFIATDRVPIEGAEVEEGVKPIPMWIADMSFPTAPFIIEGMKKRLEMPNLGYFSAGSRYTEAIKAWHKNAGKQQDLKDEYIGYQNGVLGGVSSAVRAFSTQGDPILVHGPIYVGFTGVLTNLGRKIVLSNLVRDEEGIWRMDYEDMDKKIKENHIHLCIFCSPHNPTGRVWERWEIEKALEVYKNNDCIVISDEIWSDIIMPGHTHIPTQCISEDAKNRVCAFYAPSKTFSLAGLVGSYHVIYNSLLRDRVMREGEITHLNGANVLSAEALIAAYSEEGRIWTDELNETIEKNMAYACSFIADNFKGVKVMKPQGTYMLYLDCSEWCEAHGVDIHELQRRGVRKGVIWQDGESFKWPNTIRMNLALPYSLLVEAFDRLKEYAFTD